MRRTGGCSGTALMCLVGAVGLFSGTTTAAQAERPSGEKMAHAYEESCVANLRSIDVAQAAYQGGDPTKGYARTLKELGPAGNGFLPQSAVSGKKDDYKFKYRPQGPPDNGPIKHYTISARPIKRLVKDQRSYFTDETNTIRFTTDNRAATSANPPLLPPFSR